MIIEIRYEDTLFDKKVNVSHTISEVSNNLLERVSKEMNVSKSLLLDTVIKNAFGLTNNNTFRINIKRSAGDPGDPVNRSNDPGDLPVICR